MSWFQIWTIAWQIAVFLTPLLLGCAILWLKAQFVTKVEFTAERNRIDAMHANDKVERDQRYDTVREKLGDHETRMRMVETDVARPPSRHELNNAISTMQGALVGLDRSVGDLRTQMAERDNDLRRQIETQNTYLRSLIEKHIA